MFFFERHADAFKWFNVSVVNIPGYWCVHVQSRLFGHVLFGWDGNIGSPVPV